MADVQLVDALDRRHRLDVVVMQAMAGVDDQPLGQANSNAVDDTLQLLGHFTGRLGIGITPGVQLDGRRADPLGGLDLALVGVDEKGHFGTDFRQPLYRRLDPRLLPRHIQAAFGGELLAGFRHQADMCRTDTLGKSHHLFGDAHFEVHAGLQHVLEQQHVALLDMPAIFAQVHGDAVGARLFRVQRCLDRVRVTGAPCLAQGGNVVDVHAKKNAIAGGHGSAPE